MEWDPERIAALRKATPASIAEEICSVQPIPADTFAEPYEMSKPESELKEEGYKPVSSLGLLWIKDKDV